MAYGKKIVPTSAARNKKNRTTTNSTKLSTGLKSVRSAKRSLADGPIPYYLQAPLNSPHKISTLHGLFLSAILGLLILTGNASYGQIFLDCPDNIIVNCAEDVPLAAINATQFNALPGASVSSGCGGNLTITHQDVITGQTCPNNYTLTRTYYVSDDCGSPYEWCDQLITVNDDQSPVFDNCPPNVSVELADSIPDPSIVTYTDCGGSYMIDPDIAPPDVYWEEVFGFENQAGFCPDSIYRYYVATDDCNNSDTCLQKIYVTNDTVCQTCADEVPFHSVDLTLPPPQEIIFTDVGRDGLCCDYALPSRCVAFNMTLHPDAVSLKVDIRQTASSPWQSASINAGEWMINCEPAVFSDHNICLTEGNFFTLTHCKPGANILDYRFTSIEGAVATGPDTVREDCSAPMSVANLANATWTSIAPGPEGTYNNYLSCTDCLEPSFMPWPPPAIPEPPVITYQVCGQLINFQCDDDTDCDEISIAVWPKIRLGCDGETFFFCEEGQPSEWAIPIDVTPVPAIYKIIITAPDGDTSTFIDQNNFFYYPDDPVSGAYSVYIEDIQHDFGCDSGYFAFNINFEDCIICPEPDTICYNDTITLNNIADFTALGGILDFPCDVDASLFNITSQSDGLYCPETITYSVDLGDICGNTASCSFDLVRADEESPVWLTAAGFLDRTVACDAFDSLAAAQALHPVAADNCDNDVSDIIKVSGDFVPDTACPTAGTYTNSWTVTDDCGNTSAEYAQVITVEPAIQAEFPPVDSLVITCDSATTFGPSTLVVTNNSLGGCLIEDTVMGVLSGTYNECGGELIQDWTYTDICDRTSTQTQVITVLPAPQAQFPAVDSITITCDSAENFQTSQLLVTNSGLGGCLIEDTVTSILSGIYDECGGFLNQIWTYTDSCGRTSTQVQVITVLPAPQAEFPPVDSVFLTCDSALTYGPSRLLVTNNGLGGCLIEDSIPSNFSGSFNECGGELIQSWTFTDDCGRTSTQSQVITIAPAPQAEFPPVDSVTITCDSATQIQPLILTVTNSGQGGCLIEEDVTGVISGIFTECGGTLIQTWEFTDNCGRTSTQMQVITVEPAPQAEFPEVDSLFLTCDEATAFGPSALTVTNEGLGGCLIEADVMGEVTGAWDECGGEMEQAWTFVDDCGRTITQSQVIMVEPAPQALFPDVDTLILSCDDALDYAAYQLTLTNEGLGGCLIEADVMGEVTGAFDECGGELQQAWSFVDGCGRITTQNQVVIVEPAPQAEFPPVDDVTISCEEALEFTTFPLIVTNSGLGGCLIEDTIQGVMTGYFDECGGDLVQQWSFTDDCARTSIQEQVITVEPAPQAQFPYVEPIVVNCDSAGDLEPYELIVTNNNLGGCLIQDTIMGVITGTYNECGGELVQSWTFTDNCARTSIQTQDITVTPSPRAQWINPPGDTALSCEVVTVMQPDTLYYSNNQTGACNIEGFVLGEITGNYDDCNGMIIQTWEFTDYCNRRISHQQTISIYDNQPPVMDTSSIGTCFETEEDAIEAALLATTITDNCSEFEEMDIIVDVQGSCQASITIIAIDLCGNSDTVRYETIIDDEDPDITCPLVYVQCALPEYPPYGSLQEFLDAGGTASDNCELDDESFSLLDEEIIGAWPDAFSILRTYGISDMCGRLSTCDQIINVPPALTVEIIPQDPSMCPDGSQQFTVNIVGGLIAYNHTWSGPGAAYLDQTNIKEPVFSGAPPGSYLLIYNVLDGNSCTASDSVQVIVHELPEVFAGIDRAIPKNTATTIDDAWASGPEPLIYHWEPADLLINPEVLHPTTVNLNATTIFTLFVTDQNGCENSDQMRVIVQGPGGELEVFVSAFPDEICEGETAQLYANATGGSGSYDYTWTSAPPGFISHLQSPFVTPSQTTRYIIEVSDGISTVWDSVEIIVNPLPVFDCPQYGPVCEGSETIIFNEPGVFSHEGLVVTEFNPDMAGDYLFTYTETTPEGCIDSCHFEIIVGAMPDVYAGADQIIVQGSNTVIGDAFVAGNAPFNYSWSPGDLLADSSILNPTTLNLDTATLFTLYVTDAYGCEGMDEVLIDVQPIVPTYLQAITGPGSDCMGNTATIPLEVENFNSVSTFQMKLSYNAEKLACEGYTNIHPLLADNMTAWVDHSACEIVLQWDSETPISFNQKEQIIELVFMLKEQGQANLDWYTGETDSYFTNPSGVQIPATFQAGSVVIYQPPVIYLEDTIYLCEEDSYTIMGAAFSTQPPVDYFWLFPDGHTQVEYPHFESVKMSDAGNYTLFATDKVGCSEQKTVTLIVSPNPQAAFHGTDTLTIQPGYLLEAGYGMAVYQWNTGDTTESIIIKYEGEYLVELWTFAGCYGIDSIYLKIPEEEIPDVDLWVPNAFTPNGDGRNETFYAVPSNENITSFKMLIYDRWGQFLWESDDITRGWDGTTKGELCPVDAYVFKIIYSAANVPGEDHQHVITGIVMLVDE